MTDIADAVRAFEPDATPILTRSRWGRTDAIRTASNCCQINMAVFTTDEPGGRERAIRALKTAIEETIRSGQTTYRGNISMPRRTASMQALGIGPEEIAIKFFRPFQEVTLPDGQHMLIAEWRTEIA